MVDTAASAGGVPGGGGGGGGGAWVKWAGLALPPPPPPPPEEPPALPPPPPLEDATGTVGALSDETAVWPSEPWSTSMFETTLLSIAVWLLIVFCSAISETASVMSCGEASDRPCSSSVPSGSFSNCAWTCSSW